MSEDFEAWLKQKQAELDAMMARVEALASGQAAKPKAKPKPEPEPEPEPAYVLTDDDYIQIGLNPALHRQSAADLAMSERLDQARATLAALGLNPARYSQDQLLSMEDRHNA